jgi:hypothetical protein
MLKREMDSCGLYALAFNYLDLLFCQPVKIIDQGVYLPVSGFYLTLEEKRSTLVSQLFGLGE